ncbi:MAG TPA: alpha/beta hydrolase [Dehalococcoidia bacterium]|nr:alpha/beta hydrolase [Dehalococcoidia bacterium]
MQLEVLTTKPPAEARLTPVLFIHGAWHGAWCWSEHFLPYFAQRNYICHALSLRAHGNSEDRKRLRWARLADYVADVDQVVSQLEKPPVLVGHSMGGLIVQKYLETHKMPAAVLLAPAPPTGVLPTTLRILRRHPLAFVKANLTLSLYPIIGSPGLTREAFFSEDMPQELVDSYFARMQDESYLAFLGMLGLELPRLKKVETPLLVLGAAKDTMFYPSEVEATAHAYNTRAEIFPNMAHDMMLEAGWQSVADRIISWLEKQGL